MSRISEDSIYHPDDRGPSRAILFCAPPKRFKSSGQKPTAAEKESAGIATETLADYEKNVKPFVGKYINRVMTDDTDKNLGMASAATDANRAFGLASNATMAAQTKSGARLGSGRSTLGMAKIAANQGASGAQTAVDVNQRASDNRIAGMVDLVNFGEGKASDASRGLSDLSSLSANQAAFDASQAAADQAGGTEAATALATYGLSQYGKSGVQPMTKMQAYTAPQAPSIGGVMTPIPNTTF